MSNEAELYKEYVNLKYTQFEKMFLSLVAESKDEKTFNEKLQRIKDRFRDHPNPQGKTVKIGGRMSELDKDLVELYFGCKIRSTEDKDIRDDDGYPLATHTIIQFDETLEMLEEKIKKLKEQMRHY